MSLNAFKATSDSFPPQFLRVRLRENFFLCAARRWALGKTLALVTLGIIWAGGGFAGGRPMLASDLEKQLTEYKNLRSLDASFDQLKELKGLQVKLKSSGSFHLRKDGDNAEVEWQVNKPSYLKLRITPVSLEIFEQEGKPGRALVDNQEAQSRILRPLYAWLSVNSRLISEQYFVYFAGKTGFRLVPKDDKSPVKSMRIILDQKRFVSAVFLEERSGDEIKINFSGTKVARSP